MKIKIIASTLWQKWEQLPQEDRQAIASQLGSVGKILNIGAAVSNIARGDKSVDNVEDEDIIDVEFKVKGSEDADKSKP